MMTDSGMGSEEFLEWVDGMVASSDMSEEELLDEIVSAYWIFEDFAREFSGDADADITPAEIKSMDPTNGRPAADTDSDTADTADQADQATPDRDTPPPADEPAQSQPQPAVSELRDELREILEEFHGWRDDQTDGLDRLAETVDEFDSRIETLADEVDNVTEQVERRDRDENKGQLKERYPRQDTTDPHLNRLAETIDKLDGRTETHSAELDAVSREIGDDKSDLLRRLDRLEQRVEQVTDEIEAMSGSTERLTRLESRLDRIASSVEDTGDTASQLEKFEDELDALESRLDQTTVEADEVSQAIRRVNQLEDQLEQVAEEARTAGSDSDRLRQFEDQLASVAERVEAVSQSLPAEVDELSADVDELAGEIEPVYEQLGEIEQAHKQLDSQIRSEFRTIEKVFEQFNEEIDAIDADLGEWTATYESDIEQISDRQRHRDQLVELKQEASQAGISEASCEACGETVDLSLLPTTACPSCDITFTGVESGGWTPFSGATLTTSADGPAPADSIGDPLREE